MKKFLPMAGILAALVATGCSDKKTQEFAETVGRLVKANQVDSLAAVYPDAVFDSIGFANDFEAIEIEKTDVDGVVRAKFGEVASINIKKDENGNLSVVESNGIAAFPKGQLEMAKKAGALKDNLSDINLMENMIFLDELNAALYEASGEYGKKAIKISNQTVTKESMYAMDPGYGYYTLTNNTDRDIKGSEYEVVWNDVYLGWVNSSTYRREKGKDIPAHGSVRYNYSFSGHSGSSLEKVVMKPVPYDEFLSNYAYDGKEFDEYMKTADKSVIKRPPLSDGPYNISGKLGGKYPIHMILEKGMKKGTYYYDKNGPAHPLYLAVKMFNRHTGRLILEETNDKGEVTGYFLGRIAGKEFKGKMTAFTGITYDFDLTVD